MLISCILYLILISAVANRRDKSLIFSRIALISCILLIVITIDQINYNFFSDGISLYSNFVQISSLTIIFHTLMFLVTAIILQLNCFYSRTIGNIYLNKQTYFNKAIFSLINNNMSNTYLLVEYSLIILFILLGGTFLTISNDLITLFISIEFQSYGIYILCASNKESENAVGGGLTYFLLGSLSSCFILLGSGLIYATTSVTNFNSLQIIDIISNYINNYYFFDLINYTNNLYYFNIALIIISIGFLFKISAAPFHFWSPDVYDAIPTNTTVFVAVFAKVSIFVVILILIKYTLFDLSSLTKHSLDVTKTISWTVSLLISSLLSLVIGSVLGLSQSRIKRLYAYSTISHVGFMLLALSLQSTESVQSFIFYLMQYTLININAFLILIAIGYNLYLYVSLESYNINDKINSPIQLIKQLQGYFNINPYMAISLAITLFSFAGIPPLIGFFAKQMVFSSALDKEYVFMVLIGILTSVISGVYYLVIIKEMFFNPSKYIYNTSFINTIAKSLNENVKFSHNISALDSKTVDSIINNKNTLTQKEQLFNDKNSELKPATLIYSIKLNSNLSLTITILTFITILFVFALPNLWLSTATALALILFNC